MYIPINPFNAPEEWDTFEKYLTDSNSLNFIVENGSFIINATPKKLSTYQATRKIAEMQTCNYVIIGTERSNPFPPHFAVKIDNDKREAYLHEYIAMENTSETINNNICLLAQLLFLQNKEIKSISLPFKLDSLDDSDFSLETGRITNTTLISSRPLKTKGTLSN